MSRIEAERCRGLWGGSGREDGVFYQPKLLWFHVRGNPTLTSLKHQEM